MDDRRKTLDLPWQGIVVVLLTGDGIFACLNPLETWRPSEKAGVSLRIDRNQDVEARLWQDPLRIAFE